MNSDDGKLSMTVFPQAKISGLCPPENKQELEERAEKGRSLLYHNPPKINPHDGGQTPEFCGRNN